MKKAYKIAVALALLFILAAFMFYQLVLYPSYAKDYSISQSAPTHKPSTTSMYACRDM